MLGAVFKGGDSSLAKEEAVGGVVGAEVFVVVESSEDGGVVGKLEELARNGAGWVRAELHARVSAEIVEAALNSGSREGLQEASGWGNGGWSAVRVERAVDEEEIGHVADYCAASS